MDGNKGFSTGGVKTCTHKKQNKSSKILNERKVPRRVGDENSTIYKGDQVTIAEQ